MKKLLVPFCLTFIIFIGSAGVTASSANPLVERCTKELTATRGFKTGSLKVSEVKNLKPSEVSIFVDMKANDGSMRDPSQMFTSSGKRKKSPMEQVAEAMRLADKHPESTFIAFHLNGETSDGKKINKYAYCRMSGKKVVELRIINQ